MRCRRGAPLPAARPASSGPLAAQSGAGRGGTRNPARAPSSGRQTSAAHTAPEAQVKAGGSPPAGRCWLSRSSRGCARTLDAVQTTLRSQSPHGRGGQAPCPRPFCVLRGVSPRGLLLDLQLGVRPRPALTRTAPAPRLGTQRPWAAPPSPRIPGGPPAIWDPPRPQSSFLLGTFPRLGVPADFPWFSGLLSRSMLNPSFVLACVCPETHHSSSRRLRKRLRRQRFPDSSRPALSVGGSSAREGAASVEKT